MLPLFLLKLVGGRKAVARIVLGVVLLAVIGSIAGFGWWVRSLQAKAEELDRIKPQYAAMLAAQNEANKKVKTQDPIDAAERTKLAEERARQEQERLAISREWARLRAVEEKPNEDGTVTVRLSDAWGVCFAAAAAGDAADVAACQTAGGDGAVAAGAGDGGL